MQKTVWALCAKPLATKISTFSAVLQPLMTANYALAFLAHLKSSQKKKNENVER